MFISKGRRVAEYGEVSQELIDGMLGSTGNLRAPLLRVARTVIVGFNEDVYGRIFG